MIDVFVSKGPTQKTSNLAALERNMGPMSQPAMVAMGFSPTYSTKVSGAKSMHKNGDTLSCNSQQRKLSVLEVQLGRAEKLLAGLGNEHLGYQSLL